MVRIDSDLCEAVIMIARSAGEAIMNVYRGDFDVTQKDDSSPVTAADLAAHRVITEALERVMPCLPILSEEAADVSWNTRKNWRSYWLVDPLDGTREFIKRNDEFSVNIALIDQGIPVLGVIQSPVSGVVWHAVRGGTAFRRSHGEDEPLHTRAPATSPLRVATSRSFHRPRTEALLSRMGVVEQVSLGSSLKFCRMAEGRLDVYPRFGPTSEWDTAAGQCILEAAGGALMPVKSGTSFRYNHREILINTDFIALGDPSLPWRQWFADEE
ncbi:MAG: 3'(2'),5'-bisphosphate nucleotidase CysQ [Xanthomonadaceae bacterium]|nr:3'(2'),5'-bisphosphate nucleotidase CysQ [Xanthomonadaceae bacterium]